MLTTDSISSQALTSSVRSRDPPSSLLRWEAGSEEQAGTLGHSEVFFISQSRVFIDLFILVQEPESVEGRLSLGLGVRSELTDE